MCVTYVCDVSMWKKKGRQSAAAPCLRGREPWRRHDPESDYKQRLPGTGPEGTEREIRSLELNLLKKTYHPTFLTDAGGKGGQV